MIKLFITLVCFGLIAASMLQLREQKREMGYEINQLHSQIESRQARLWNQQLQIAIYTAPNAISQTIGAQDLKLVPPQPVGAPAVRPERWNAHTPRPRPR